MLCHRQSTRLPQTAAWVWIPLRGWSSRAELIDGQIYYMAPPSRKHQDILSFLHLAIGNHIANNSGECKVYPAPFAVFLFADDSKYLEPDISVV